MKSIAFILIIAGLTILVVSIFRDRPQPIEQSAGEAVRPPASESPASESEDNYVAALQTITISNKLRWDVFDCRLELTQDTNTNWTATAEHIESKGIYIEDGALPYWISYGHTRIAALKMLLERLREPEGSFPKHRSESKKFTDVGKISGGYGKELQR